MGVLVWTAIASAIAFVVSVIGENPLLSVTTAGSCITLNLAMAARLKKDSETD